MLQRFLVAGLGQIAKRPGSDDLLLHVLFETARDKDGWWAARIGNQLRLQARAAHPGQMNVENQTYRVIDAEI
jgi:hypothetical protein